VAAARKPVLRALLLALAVVVAGVAGFAAWLIVPIVVSSPQGASGQELVVEGFPSSVSATGEDSRTRVLSAVVDSPEGGSLDRLVQGDRIIVSGAGYNPRSGIYVAICQVPKELGLKPGPCLGGVPSTEAESPGVVGAVEYGPSNWINDDWAWRLFGARSFDDRASGTFTAYIEVPAAADGIVDCRAVGCGLYTRNDHTAVDDRVQDLYLPVAFAE
jgi:hypothetical protein